MICVSFARRMGSTCPAFLFAGSGAAVLVQRTGTKMRERQKRFRQA